MPEALERRKVVDETARHREVTLRIRSRWLNPFGGMKADDAKSSRSSRRRTSGAVFYPTPARGDKPVFSGVTTSSPTLPTWTVGYLRAYGHHLAGR